MSRVIVVILFALTVGSCVEPLPSARDERANARDVVVNNPLTLWPDRAYCHEFDWRTTAPEGETVCRVLWCRLEAGNGSIGGPAVLWCRAAADR